MSIEAMKQALEVIEAAIKSGDWKVDGACDPDMAIHGLRQAIAEAEKQEPNKYEMDIECNHCGAKQSYVLAVHTHPLPKREPLTDQQIAAILERGDVAESNDKVGWCVLPYSFARAIEAAHGIKEKNT